MPPDAPVPARPARQDGCAALALAGFVFFARVWLIHGWGSAVPYWDQWDAEALGLYRPWLTGSLHWVDLFAAHNEHRITLTRLADLALFNLAGGWNPWWQMLVNAGLHALTAVGLFLLARPVAPGKLRPALLVGLAVLFANPAGWQNALWGFQSQVYFGNLLALVALAGFAAGPAFGPAWWLGWPSALLAFFANGGGLLTVAASLPIIALSSGFRGARRGYTLLALLTALGMLVAGALLHTRVAHHDSLHPKDVSSFVTVVRHCLGWPWVDSTWAWLPLQAPWIWLVADLIRKRQRPDASERFLIGLVLWAGFHATAIAWSRGAGLPEGRPLSRYQDPLLVGAAANFLILLRFIPRHRFARSATLLWAGCVLAGLLSLTTHVLAVNLPFKRQQDAAGLSQLRDYLTAHDPRVLANTSPVPPLHPDVRVVQQVLDDPVLRPVLPAETLDRNARPPLLIVWGPWVAGLALVALSVVAWPRRDPESSS